MSANTSGRYRTRGDVLLLSVMTEVSADWQEARCLPDGKPLIAIGNKDEGDDGGSQNETGKMLSMEQSQL